MTSTSTISPTLRWLKSVIGPYSYQEFVMTDVDRTLTTFTALSPKTEQYIYDDGRQALLLCLSGTIPISFKSMTYNIPVALWLPHEYPKTPPIAYVTPTSTMLVRPSKIVDVSGRLGGEYLSSWARKSEGCNMVQFCELLQAVFSREPPLYAKPASSVSPTKMASARPSSSGTPPPVSPTSGGHRPAPLPPGVGSPAMSGRQPLPDARRVTSAPTPPPRPPLPQEPLAGPSRHATMPMPQINGMHSDWIRGNTINAGGHRPAPRPPLPHVPVNQPLSPQQQQQSPSQFRTLHAPQHATSAPAQVYYTNSAPHIAQNAYAGQGPPSYSHPPVPPHPIPQPVAQAQAEVAAARNLLDEPDDLASPSSDRLPGQASAPARPVNPETLKLRAALQTKLENALSALANRHQAEAESLASLGADLAKGPPALQDEMARLEAVRDVCLHVRDRYADVVGRAEQNMADLTQKGETEVDDLVCSTTVVYNQLLDLVAEDHAIEDTCYQLYGALNADPPRIELDKFLKRIRTLGREQFVKRALANKIILEMAIRPPR